MNNIRPSRRRRAVWLLSAFVLGWATVLPGRIGAARAISPSPDLSGLSPSPVSAPTPTPLAESVPHLIGVRQSDAGAEFYNRSTGETFVPRGYNYARLSPIFGTSGQMWEETLAPGLYDPAIAEASLRQMQADGYNIVRVIVDCCRPSRNVGSNQYGISPAYIDNVVDFLNRAKAHELYVYLVLHLTPAEGPYNQSWDPYTGRFAGANLRYLTRGGFTAKARYDQDFIRALIERQAPLDVVFAYDLTDGVGYDTDQLPFTLEHDTRVNTVNGNWYDIAVPEERRRMMDENMVYWIDEQRAAILEVDPTALVTASFRTPTDDSRQGHPHPAWGSAADFVEVDVILQIGDRWENYPWLFREAQQVDGASEKPILIGRLAAAGFSGSQRAEKIIRWQAASCEYGVDGWLLTDFFGPQGTINDALAPVNRPDPCEASPASQLMKAISVLVPVAFCILCGLFILLLGVVVVVAYRQGKSPRHA